VVWAFLLTGIWLYGIIEVRRLAVTIKTTLTIDKEIYKAAKRVAVEREMSLSSILRKALLVYVSDPEGVEETTDVLMDPKALEAILQGQTARKEKRAGYYVTWEKVRDL